MFKGILIHTQFCKDVYQLYLYHLTYRDLSNKLIQDITWKLMLNLLKFLPILTVKLIADNIARICWYIVVCFHCNSTN